MCLSQQYTSHTNASMTTTHTHPWKARAKAKITTKNTLTDPEEPHSAVLVQLQQLCRQKKNSATTREVNSLVHTTWHQLTCNVWGKNATCNYTNISTNALSSKIQWRVEQHFTTICWKLTCLLKTIFEKKTHQQGDHFICNKASSLPDLVWLVPIILAAMAIKHNRYDLDNSSLPPTRA